MRIQHMIVRNLHHVALLFVWVFALVMSSAHAQTMDYNLSQAARTVDSVATDLQRLQQNDINGFNRLSSKLNKAAQLLETTESKAHPDFTTTVKKWSVLQQQMAQIAVELQAAQAQHQQALAAQQEQLAAQEKSAPTKAAVEPVNLDLLMAKYERNALPKLVEQPSPQDARSWAVAMHELQTTHLQNDLATIAAAMESGAASSEDAKRVRFWITDSFQRTILEQTQQAAQQEENTIGSIMRIADLINRADEHDKNQAYRFAGDNNYERNRAFLENALRAGTVVRVYGEVFGTALIDRTAQINSLQSAREKLDVMRPLATQQASSLASALAEKPPVAKDFLEPIAQEFWLNGGILAQTEEDGSIWMESNDVGDITGNGEIWIDSNEVGSIEPNGDVWFDGNHVGSLQPNGEVWRGGNQVGLIEQNGTAWVNGSPGGEITPFQGEWRRAAILYYFTDFLVR